MKTLRESLELIHGDVLKAGFQALCTKDGYGLQGIIWALSICASNCAISKACRLCPVYLLTLKLQGMNFKAEMQIENILDPLRLKHPRFVFVCPQGDLFHEDIPTWFIARVMAVIDNCPDHLFSVLTKRADRMGKLFSSSWFWKLVEAEGKILFGSGFFLRETVGDNVLAGVTIESQEYMYRADIFLVLPRSMIRVVYASPLLSHLDLSEVVRQECGWTVQNKELGNSYGDPRPCKDEWVLSLYEQCRDADIPFYTQDRWTPELIGRLGPYCREFPRHKFYKW